MSQLVKVELSKEWNKHKAGSKLEVDAGRAEWLKSNGYLEVVKKSGRVSKSKTD